eukprot:1696090-Alexandrium_andersonii.AAC.1
MFLVCWCAEIATMLHGIQLVTNAVDGKIPRQYVALLEGKKVAKIKSTLLTAQHKARPPGGRVDLPRAGPPRSQSEQSESP